MEPLAEKALQAVEKGELTIIPERFEKVCPLLYTFPIPTSLQLSLHCDATNLKLEMELLIMDLIQTI
jgi:hypothetical protein